MKKAYINPETSIVLLTMQSVMTAASVEGFNPELDETETINPEDMLSRRRNNVWDDEEELEEEMEEEW